MVEHYLAFTKNKILLFVTRMNLILNKTNQTERDKCCGILLIYRLGRKSAANSQQQRVDWESPGTGDGKGQEMLANRHHA